jgi:hypothetical protein
MVAPTVFRICQMLNDHIGQQTGIGIANQNVRTGSAE